MSDRLSRLFPFTQPEWNLLAQADKYPDDTSIARSFGQILTHHAAALNQKPPAPMSLWEHTMIALWGPTRRQIKTLAPLWRIGIFFQRACFPGMRTISPVLAQLNPAQLAEVSCAMRHARLALPRSSMAAGRCALVGGAAQLYGQQFDEAQAELLGAPAASPLFILLMRQLSQSPALRAHHQGLGTLISTAAAGSDGGMGF